MEGKTNIKPGGGLDQLGRLYINRGEKKPASAAPEKLLSQEERRFLEDFSKFISRYEVFFISTVMYSVM